MYHSEDTDKIRDLVRKIVIERTRSVCMNATSKTFDVLPVEYCKDEFGAWKYDPLEGQMRIYAMLNDDEFFPDYWKLLENVNYHTKMFLKIENTNTFQILK